MKMTNDFISCRNEQQFKMKWLRLNKDPNVTHFCIETGETVKGFPDVMFVGNASNKVHFAEFKYTNTGKIKFQPSQPAFYKKYPHLPITIIAYNGRTNHVHSFDKEELFRRGSAYKMNINAEVDLRKAEGNK